MKSIPIVKVLSYLMWLTNRETALIAKIEYRIFIPFIKLYYLPLVIWMNN